MQLGEALYTQLAASTTITEIIGSTNIYPMAAAENSTFPFVTYQLIMETAEHSMVRDPNIRHPRYQIGVFSTSYDQAHQISKAIKGVLQDYSGTMGGAGGVSVQRCFWEMFMEFAYRDPETNQLVHHLSNDFIIWYSSS